MATQVRRDIIRMVHAPQSGHPGGSLDCVEFFTALYMGGLMKHNNNFSMEGKNEDVFILFRLLALVESTSINPTHIRKIEIASDQKSCVLSTVYFTSSSAYYSTHLFTQRR